jgi:heterodisulfide reductase subunit D
MAESSEASSFDYAGYFRRIRQLERLAVNADEITWREKYQPPERSVDVLLYLGCNVLITTHLAIEVTAVLKAMGVDFEAIGGPQFCCGIVHHGEGDVAAAGRLSRSTVEKMKSYGAKTLIMWCPSCDLHFDEVVLPTVGQDLTPTITHATQFLSERTDQLPFVHEVPARVAVHTHVGHPRQERDAAACLRLLEAVPGVEVVGTLASPSLGYHCPTPPNRQAAEHFMSERSRLLAEAEQLGADTVVTLYHSCQREWCDAQQPGLAVRNYISLVAESLGCASEDRYVHLRQAKDAKEAVEVSRPQWTSHGWDEDQANEIAGSYLPVIPEQYRTSNG